LELGQAKIFLGLLEEKVQTFTLVLEKNGQEKTKEVKNKALTLEALETSIELKLKKLKALFTSSKKNSLKSAYIYPLTEDELKEIEQAFKDKKKSKAFKELKKIKSEKDYTEVLDDYQAIAFDFENILTWAEKTDEFLGKKINYIENDAENHYQQALLLLESQPNATAQDLLNKSLESLNEADYLNSIKFSDAATSLLSLTNQPQAGNLPLALIPLIILLAGLGFIKWRNKKEAKPSFSFLEDEDYY
jgi:hypothetical protein